MVRGEVKRFYTFFLIAILFVIVLNVFTSIFIYNNINLDKISGYVSSEGTIGLTVEGVDLTYPNVSLVYPIATTYTSHVTALNYTAVDNNNLGSCWYSLNSGITNNSVTCGNNVSGISSSEGSNTWIIYVNDTAGNENSSLVTFTVTLPDGGTGGSGGGGGGGGGAPVSLPPELFSVSPEDLNLFVVSGEISNGEITVVNIAKSDIIIDLAISGIDEFASLSTNQLALKPGEVAKVVLSFIAPDPGVYAGRITLTSGNIKGHVFVALNSRSEKDALFDVSLSPPESFRIMQVGRNLKAFISLLQVGDAEEVDVTINYIIKDFDGNELFRDSETMRIFREKSFVKEFPTLNLEPGEYIAGIEVIYPDGVATSSAHFTIIEKVIDPWLITSIVLAFLTIFIIVYSMLRYKKLKKHVGRRR